MENRFSGPPGGAPVIPLPNPGEGGPVYPGGDVPVVPLPNPGEGGPVNPGPGGNPGNPGGPQPGPGGNPGNPGRPQPGPGGGQPPSYPGGIQLLPGSSYPSVTGNYAAVRFLNATSGYPPFRITVDGAPAVNLLDAGSATRYLRVPSGSRIITVSGLDGYIYLQQSLRFPAGSASTVAIVNRTGGLALRRITDNCPTC